MGTITERRDSKGNLKYRAEVRRMVKGEAFGKRRTFDDPGVAEAWIKALEERLDHPVIAVAVAGQVRREQEGTLGQLIQSYIDKFRTVEQWGISKQRDLEHLQARIGDWPNTSVTPERFIEHWLQRFEGGTSPSTIAKDVAWLRVVFRTSESMKWTREPLFSKLTQAQEIAKRRRLIGRARSRERRLQPGAAQGSAFDRLSEEEKLLQHFRNGSERAKVPHADIVLFALASTRRLEEITKLQWSDLDKKNMVILVREMKDPARRKGDNNVLCKISDEGLKIIERQQRTPGVDRIFPYNHRTIGTIFARAVQLLGLPDLHFHDLRHEAISRLFERRYRIQEVAQFTGHKDWNSLRRYTQLDPRKLALRKSADADRQERGETAESSTAGGSVVAGLSPLEKAQRLFRQGVLEVDEAAAIAKMTSTQFTRSLL